MIVQKKYVITYLDEDDNESTIEITAYSYDQAISYAELEGLRVVNTELAVCKYAVG